MTQHTIEVEGLPEGWKAVAYRLGKEGEMAFINKIWELERDSLCPVIIVEKIQPRRIVLEETEEGFSTMDPQYFSNIDWNLSIQLSANKIWKEVKE